MNTPDIWFVVISSIENTPIWLPHFLPIIDFVGYACGIDKIAMILRGRIYCVLLLYEMAKQKIGA